MEVQAISPQAFSIVINERELRLRHLSPTSVTAAAAMELICELTGSRPSGPASLELFPGRHELLIFVRQDLGELRFFRFPDAESLIRAALDRSFSDPSTLFLYGDGYILAHWWPGPGDPEALREYAVELKLPDSLLPHLYEHGRTLIDGCAASRLQAVFS